MALNTTMQDTDNQPQTDEQKEQFRSMQKLSYGLRVDAMTDTKLPEELKNRLDTLESFYQTHGGETYTGITIQQVIAQAIQSAEARERKRIKNIVKEKIEILFPDNIWEKIINEVPPNNKVFGKKEELEWILSVLTSKGE